MAWELKDLVQLLLNKRVRRRSGSIQIDQSQQDLNNKNPFRTQRHFCGVLEVEEDKEINEGGEYMWIEEGFAMDMCMAIGC